MPKFLELFAGAGGMTMGFEAAGWECVGHAEIEPHARAVLRKRWPDVPLYGDVCQLDGTTLPPFDLLTFGAPCQDLSIAGKRAGMAEGSGTRSSLFFEAIRIWRESNAPLALYENVLGAYSSNNGKDFAAVLSAFVGAAVPVPADGWRGAGVASGPAGVAAWRTVDLQHFGWDGNTTPQRRRRVFVLGARTGSVDPAEVLLVADGLLGHLATGGEAGQGVAPDTGAGIAATFDPVNVTSRTNRTKVEFGRPSQTIHSAGMHVLTYDARGNGDGQTVNTLAVVLRNRVTDYTALAVNISNAAANLDPVMGTLGSRSGGQEVGAQTRGVVLVSGESVTATLTADYGDKMGLNDQHIYSQRGGLYPVEAGVPRRLLPVECERLMGWPDQHTAHGIDERGREYALSDTARYKLCGNGIGSPVTAWIGWRLQECLKPAP